MKRTKQTNINSHTKFDQNSMTYKCKSLCILHLSYIFIIYNINIETKIVRKLKRAKYNRFWSKGTIYITVLLGAPNAIFWAEKSFQRKVITFFLAIAFI